MLKTRAPFDDQLVHYFPFILSTILLYCYCITIKYIIISLFSTIFYYFSISFYSYFFINTINSINRKNSTKLIKCTPETENGHSETNIQSSVETNFF